jgi:hypothetical protein
LQALWQQAGQARGLLLQLAVPALVQVLMPAFELLPKHLPQLQAHWLQAP